MTSPTLPCLPPLRRLVTIVAALATCMVPAAATAGSTAITECGMSIRGAAHLPASLDCSAYSGDALRLHGRLALQGFTLTGSQDPAGEDSAIDCIDNDSACRIRIRGPGSIRSGHYGVTGRVVVLSDAGVYGSWNTGIVGAKVKLRRAAVSENGAAPASSGLERCGVRAGKAVLAQSTLNDNGSCGADAGRIALRRVTFIGNGDYDFRSIARPSGRQVFCENSRTGEPGQTWGLCRADGPPLGSVEWSNF